ncbi:hypothetical protein LX99_03202 [Mucilaginibacter oryzae]|uniref:Uncharacterized protein n=1 Tax=Mucilaginibacter oryzae TaxID=468058 RepID=A0A316H8B5_9SPHI|nr:hypothetical protein LX99_03202 [Mucilaginibacter oryzae]
MNNKGCEFVWMAYLDDQVSGCTLLIIEIACKHRVPCYQVFCVTKGSVDRLNKRYGLFNSIIQTKPFATSDS